MNTAAEEEPRLVNAGQGFSVLKTVEYKGRFLYSKYSPSRAIEASIEKLQIQSGSLVIICSPLLWYGLEKLDSFLAQDCAVIALEDDENLWKLAKSSNDKNIPLFRLHEGEKIDFFIRTLCNSGKIKRAIKIDFSAGVQFSREKFDFTFNAASEIIATFWKNRITLVKFGRLFSKNLLRNIARLETSVFLEDVRGIISKPILVLGAGEGLDSLSYEQCRQGNFFIIAVDAALSPLISRGIIPDAAVTMECQQAIERAFLGLNGKKIPLFMDLCARPETAEISGGNTIWFATKYSEGRFFNNLISEGIVREFLEPMGSVGLAATYIALQLRKDASIPVFVAGLDFSYSTGATHAKGTMAWKQRFINSGRLNPIENYDAAFSLSAQPAVSKNGKTVRTTKILLQYAQQFRIMFKNEQNLFDCSATGIPIGIPQKLLFAAEKSVTQEEKKSNRKNTLDFCRKEKESLEKLRSLLSEGENSVFRDEKIPLEEQIRKLAEKREYLFLHFPDGCTFKMEKSFLKRIRAETDYFIKQLDIALGMRLRNPLFP
ncbi:6-hydroxymethylpterin diphosphokinase MptE-like protein [Treponema sp.]|uniref:6-hydroxymethylpterin diphosphokinase MptE-like protein n=1 Tax=Treponema sp. TaxID=166 RepID=UPI003F12064E